MKVDSSQLLKQDPYLRCDTLAATQNPQQIIWLAMHQDYSEEYVYDELDKWPSEDEAGELIVKHLLSGNRGHYGPLEHPQITLNIGGFPHSTMQQLRTHRVGISFDVTSFRYTGKRIIDVANGDRYIESVFYLRPVGEYTNRQGKTALYTNEMRAEDLELARILAFHYATQAGQGLAEEHARSLIPFDTRQNFVVSCNARSLMHLLDLRWKKDAQLEAQAFAELAFQKFEQWCPSVAEWYLKNRAKKAILSP